MVLRLHFLCCLCVHSHHCREGAAHPNVTVRPEVRGDWFEPAGAAGSPFDGGAENKLFTFGVDAILTY